MITILSKKQLHAQRAKYVYVKRDDQMYVRIGSEYAPKRYFTGKELADILGIETNRLLKVHRLCRKVGVMNKQGYKLRLTHEQFVKAKEIYDTERVPPSL